jgi:ABC-type antimicrobial peptide transport system permease subunit
MLHHLKLTFRNLQKYKSQTVIGTLGLATASVVFAIICCSLSFVLLQNTEFQGSSRMHELRTRDFQTSIIGGLQTLGNMTKIEKYTIFQLPYERYALLSLDDNRAEHYVTLRLQECDTSFMSFFSLKTMIGNEETILNTPNSIVLFENTAKRLSAIDNLQGKTLIINDVAYTITGILKNLSSNTTFIDAEGLIFNHVNGELQKNVDVWKPSRTELVIMLAKGVSKDKLETYINNYQFNFEIQPDITINKPFYITSISGHRKFKEILYITLVFFVGLIILSIALVNIISFQTTQFYNRLKECALIRVFGANRLQILLLFYMEIVIIFLLSYVIGLLAIIYLEPILQQTNISRFFTDDLRSKVKYFLLFSTFFGLLLTLSYCFFFVHIISRKSLQFLFVGRLSERQNRLQIGRKVMLFIQMFTVVIFFSTMLLFRTQTNLLKNNIWHTLSVEEQKDIYGFSYNGDVLPNGSLDVIIQRLEQSSAVENVFICDMSFFAHYRHGYTMKMDIHNYKDVWLRYYAVNNNFTDFFNAKMLQGRWWNDNDPTNFIVVDELFASLYPENNPIGEFLENNIIIGVVENIQMLKEQGDASDSKRPLFYRQFNKNENYLGIYVRAVSGSRSEMEQIIVQIQNEFYPLYFQGYTDIHTEINSVITEESMFSKLFSIFSSICLILCLLTINSAITMNTEKRRKEVAIRKINGATTINIILLFSKTYILMWSLSCLLLFPLIYYFGNIWLETFSNRITLNIWFFSSIYLSILFLIFFATIFKILEVSRCNITIVLKSE